MGPGPGVKAYAAATTACSAGCTSVADADVLCEDAEGTGYVCTGWTESVSGTGAINEDASHSGTLSCTDKGTQAWQWTAANTDTAYSYKSITETDALYANFYMNITSLTAYSSSHAFSGYLTNVWDYGFILQVESSSGSTSAYKLKLVAYNGQEATTSAAYDVGTWYRVGVKYVSGTEARLYINGTEAGAITASMTARNLDGVYIGSRSSQGLVGQIDIFKLDNDTMPGACP
jgi:hypothetical protein